MCNKSFFPPAISNCFGISGQYIFWYNPLKGFCSAFMVLNKVETGSQDITILQITNDYCRKGVDQPNGPTQHVSIRCTYLPYQATLQCLSAVDPLHGYHAHAWRIRSSICFHLQRERTSSYTHQVSFWLFLN